MATHIELSGANLINFHRFEYYSNTYPCDILYNTSGRPVLGLQLDAYWAVVYGAQEAQEWGILEYLPFPARLHCRGCGRDTSGPSLPRYIVFTENRVFSMPTALGCCEGYF